MMVGLYFATSSKLAILSAIVITAVADGLSDAVSLHSAEEAETEKGEPKHTAKEIWLTTLFAFLAIFGLTLTFTIPILIFSLETAVSVAIAWGITFLVIVNVYIGRIRKGNVVKTVFEHVLIAVFVIIISYFVGGLMATWFQ